MNWMRHRRSNHDSNSRLVSPLLDCNVEQERLRSEARELLRRFDPNAVGFGIVALRGDASTLADETKHLASQNRGTEGCE
jgi:hypothetical protein